MRRLKLLVCLIAASLCSLALAASASALPFTVNSSAPDTTDTNPGDGECDVTLGMDVCTLAGAIHESNATPAADSIDFSVPGPFGIFTSLIVTNPLTIDGNGSGVGGTVVDGNESSLVPSVFNLSMDPGESVTLKDLRVEDGVGSTGGDSHGAGINAANADLTLDNVTVTSNQLTGSGSGTGAGVSSLTSTRTLTIQNSTISGNTISKAVNNNGAGVHSAGPLVITNSVVDGNQITAGVSQVGAGVNAADDLTITASTISGNQATGGAPGGLNASGPAGKTITNTTISGNTGNGFGGGATLSFGTTITNTTFANNTATAGADLNADLGGPITVQNSIFASANACREAGTGDIQSATPGHNIDNGMTCGFGNTQANMENTNPMIFFAQAGSPLHTVFIPAYNSPAIDNADPACGGGLGTDQRGVSRPQGGVGNCDIGAYERDYRLVTVNKTGAGTVTGTGIDCGGDCTESFLDGGPDVVLTAAPGAGSQFTSWAGDCESISGNQCTVDVGNDRAVTATFTALPVVTPPAETPAKKKCKKGRKLKKGKCVKKKKKRRK